MTCVSAIKRSSSAMGPVMSDRFSCLPLQGGWGEDPGPKTYNIGDDPGPKTQDIGEKGPRSTSTYGQTVWTACAGCPWAWPSPRPPPGTSGPRTCWPRTGGRGEGGQSGRCPARSNVATVRYCPQHRHQTPTEEGPQTLQALQYGLRWLKSISQR